MLIAYDRLAPLAEIPATIEPHLPLLDIGRRARLKPDGSPTAEPAKKKQKLVHRVSPVTQVIVAGVPSSGCKL